MLGLRDILWRGAIVVLIVCVALALRWRHIDTRLFTSDGADYARAAQAPAVDLYLGTHEASLVRLFMLWRNPRVGTHLFDYLSRQKDTTAMRHFHAPVSFYIMSAVHALGGEERAQRGASSLAGAMVGAVTAGGLLCLGAPWGASLLAGIVVVADSGFITVTTDISPHPWYILFALSCLMLSAFTLRTGSRRAYIAAWVTFALSIATLEFAPLLVAAFVLAAVIAQLAKLPEADKFIPSSPLSWMVRHLLILAALDEALDILPGGFPVDGFDFPFKFTSTPFPINGYVFIFPRAGLVECGGEQDVVRRRLSGGVPDEVVPVSTFDVFAAEQGVEFPGKQTWRVKDSRCGRKGEVKIADFEYRAGGRAGVHFKFYAEFA